MAQQWFFGTYADSEGLLGEILSAGLAVALPDVYYETPEPRFFDAISDELSRGFHFKGRAYLWLPDLSVTPISFGLMDVPPFAGKYYVAGGGPMLDFLRPAAFVEGGMLMLNTGQISYEAVFFNPYTSTETRMPDSVRLRYRDIVKLVRAKTETVSYVGKRWLVGSEAARLLKRGEAQFVPFRGSSAA
jgi:hypothetical protein